MTAYRERGSISIQFLAILTLVTAIACAASSLISIGMKAERRATERKIRYENALAIVDSVLEDLASDPTPEVNSSDDPVWKRNNTVVSDFKISLRPISDTINPNFVRKNVFDKTSLAHLFKQGKNADALQQFREDHGLSLSDTAYLTFFDEEHYARYFSGYGWANVNITDEFAARMLARSITGSDSEAENVFNAIQKLLLSGTLASRTTLGTVLGSSYSNVFPFLNAEPPMNINFVEPLILRELAAYPEYKVSDPQDKCENILALRENSAINSREISGLFGIEETNRLSCYFGSLTWFYEIRLKDNSGTFIVILCRIPRKYGDPESTPIYQIIEMRQST